MSVVREFKLPDLGEGLTESELVSWRVAVGDTVELNQIIAEVETAKALVELPSPFAGVVKKLYEDAGSTVAVGAPIVAFEVADGTAADQATDAAGQGVETQASEQNDGSTTPAAPSEARAERNSVLVGYGPPVEGGKKPARRKRASNWGSSEGSPAPRAEAPADQTARSGATAEQNVTPAGTEVPAERPRSTPPVRKLARDLGIDLTQVTGTGEDGLITRDDVQAAAAAGGHVGAETSAPMTRGLRAEGPRETRTPIKGVRKHTAQAMVASAFTAPHVTEFLTVDVTPTMELLAGLKGKREFAEYRLNILTVVAKAMCVAISRTPSVNSRWDDAAQEIVQFNYVNLGIAAATPRGLMVPNIKDADRLTLTELATAQAALTETARAGRTSTEELSGGTISITNVGVFGIDAGTPILNPGEAAILAMGAMRRVPWEYQGEIALRQVMTLSLSFDHRLVDGEQGSRFLADVGAILAEPGMVLTMV